MSKLITWSKRNLDLTFTIICGILIVFGFILNNTGFHIASNIVFGAAIIIGGYESAKEGVLEFKTKKKLDANILMILAAIGACIIDHFSEGAILIFIFSLSHSLEHYTENKSRDAISELMKIVPETARKYQEDGTIAIVETKDLEIGDRIQIPKGELASIDGELVDDWAYLNEASITGESMPVNKRYGDAIIGGTLNEGESFDMIVTVKDQDTMMSKIVRMVDEAQNKLSETESTIGKLEGIFVKSVLIFVPLFIVLMPLIFAWPLEQSFYRGMVMLTVASPCALVASASPAKLSAISRAAKQGMILRGGDILDVTATVDTVVFDKTGTLTLGMPRITDYYYHDPEQADLVNRIVKSAESTSTHPIANAFMISLSSTEIIELDQIEDITGKGFRLEHQAQIWKIGNRSLVFPKNNQLELTAAEKDQIDLLEQRGSTVVFVTCNDRFMAYFAITDPVKLESKTAIASLKEQGIETIMLTGDEEKNAKYIADLLEVDQVKANLLPVDKLEIIKDLQSQGKKVLMVGDGVNDAPALATSDVGIAMGSGTDVAMETADIILVKNNLCRVPFIIGMSKQTGKIIKQNIVFSLAVILFLIVVNVLQLINLPLGVVAHEGSTILVILNGLRMLAYGKIKKGADATCDEVSESTDSLHQQYLEQLETVVAAQDHPETEMPCFAEYEDCLVQYGYAADMYCKHCRNNPNL
ncbi:MAG: heavy metal translocating P-type ATPase [Clostridiaceae bacterium]|jgi:Cd2+/Zn2+-exporting ATPase|nr:heavy metal translocating P-type ATPase [Clostridiaceae bacterium]